MRGARFTCDRRAPWECFVVVCFVRFVVAASFVVFLGLGTSGAVSRRDTAPRAPFRFFSVGLLVFL